MEAEREKSPLIIAARDGQADVVERELAAGADPNTLGIGDLTALHYAAFQADEGMARMLIGAGACVETRTSQGDQPLMLAAFSGSVPIVEMLIAAGADPSATGREGWNPIIAAASIGRAAVIRSLVAAGADPESSCTEGRAMHLASIAWKDSDGMGGPAAMAALVEAGADPDARDALGMTPMQRAAWAGKIESVRALVEMGAKIDGGKGDGPTALDLARLNGHGDIVGYLTAVSTSRILGAEAAAGMDRAKRRI